MVDVPKYVASEYVPLNDQTAVAVVAPLVFIVLCAMNKRLSDTNRIIGILVILFVPILGIIIYLVLPRLPLEDN